MTGVITPASNALWSVEDPQSDADWQELADAADALVDASEKIRRGGSGPNDMEWAADPAWQSFLSTLAGAASDAQDAAVAKDLDSLLDANDVLYPPCEECHLQFHPGVREQEFN